MKFMGQMHLDIPSTVIELVGSDDKDIYRMKEKLPSCNIYRFY
jgi:hypothetical protein